MNAFAVELVGLLQRSGLCRVRNHNLGMGGKGISRSSPVCEAVKLQMSVLSVTSERRKLSVPSDVSKLALGAFVI